MHACVQDEIRSLDRFREIPHEGGFCDLMWSDPEEDQKAEWGVSMRGAGFLFNGAVAKRWCRDNGLELICRAHQLVNEGCVFACVRMHVQRAGCVRIAFASRVPWLLTLTCLLACAQLQVLLLGQKPGHGVVRPELLLPLRKRGTPPSRTRVLGAFNAAASLLYRAQASVLLFDEHCDREVRVFKESASSGDMSLSKGGEPLLAPLLRCFAACAACCGPLDLVLTDVVCSVLTLGAQVHSTSCEPCCCLPAAVQIRPR